MILQHCLAAPRAVVYVAAARGRSGLGDSNHGVLGQAVPTAGGTGCSLLGKKDAAIGGGV